LKLKWRVELGSSYSGAILDKDTVYVTESEGNNEVVCALDRKNGREKWNHKWAGKMTVPFFAWSNGSWIRSTPALANGKLFIGGMRDHLVCLDAKSGKRLWEIDFPKEMKTPLPSFGCVCSPMVDGKFVYMQAGAGFCKIEQDTGKILWRIMKDEGGMYGSAFSSPVIATLAGKRQILVQSRTELAGVDIESGGVLWQQPIKAFRGMNILTPLPYKEGVYTSAYGGRSHFFGIKRDSEAWKSMEQWENKAQAYMCSPVLFEGHVYLHLRNQRFACYDLKEGKEAWVSSKRFGKYMSLVRQGGKILALDQNGMLYLIRANPEKLDVMDSRKISKQETWAHLAVGTGQLAVRELKAISFYDWK
jgi:outer membrane protein assembly factor BamB